MRQKFVVGNWKMQGNKAFNLSLLDAVKSGLTQLDDRAMQVAVCVPYPYLAQAEAVLAGSAIAWGAQDVSEHPLGAYTGEVSAGMLQDFSCRYVIVGHSERRSYYGDTDAIVAKKTVAALAARLTPIVCVGETLAEREAGDTHQVILRQLDAVVARCDARSLAQVVLAYEPVWAIGTGKTATSAQAQEVHALIRHRISEVSAPTAAMMQILYGGSVKPNNAAELFAQADIDGGLIGGAALAAPDFLAICAAARATLPAATL